MTLKIEHLSESRLKDFVNYLENLPQEAYSKNIVLDEKDILSFRYYPGNKYVVAVDIEGKILGHICIMQPKVKYGYHQEHIVEIHINVLNNYQGKGVGKAMLEYFLDWIKKNNLKKNKNEKIKKIKTKILANNKKVIKLFEKFGFKKEALLEKEWKVISNDKGKEKESYEDAVLMGLLVN